MVHIAAFALDDKKPDQTASMVESGCYYANASEEFKIGHDPSVQN